MEGLGSTSRRTTLYVPMIGPTPQTPWATADRQLLENSRPSIERELGRPFEIAEVPIRIIRGDDMRLRPTAIKIDVEGLELDVLQGFEMALAESEPLLMIERNLGSDAVAAWLEARGYELWVYDSAANRLISPADAPAPANFIACTPAWLARFPQVASLTARRAEHRGALQSDSALAIVIGRRIARRNRHPIPLVAGMGSNGDWVGCQPWNLLNPENRPWTTSNRCLRFPRRPSGGAMDIPNPATAL